MEPQWVQSIFDQCRKADVAFFFKQWGGIRKDLTGRELHGRTYDEMPVARLRQHSSSDDLQLAL
jgi:protein gp37